MQYSEPNDPILIQHDKDGSGGLTSFRDILLATLFSKLTVYSLLFTQVRISDAAIDGLWQEVIERRSKLGRCRVLFCRHIPMVATLVLQDEMTVHDLGEWYYTDNFVGEFSFVHEFVAS